MTNDAERLAEFATELQVRSKAADKLTSIINPLKKSAEAIGRSSSGSWLGYHANIYYLDFEVPPPRAHFSQEWGLERLLSGLGSSGDWIEYSTDVVIETILNQAGHPDLKPPRDFYGSMKEYFADVRQETLCNF